MNNYGDIYRIERLNLPTFEDMLRKTYFSFLPKASYIPMMIIFDTPRDIIWMKDKYSLYYNWCGINEENYEKACQEAIRLFLGDNYERN